MSSSLRQLCSRGGVRSPGGSASEHRRSSSSSSRQTGHRHDAGETQAGDVVAASEAKHRQEETNVEG